MWWEAPEGQQRPAQALAAARRPHRPVRVAPRESGSTPCTAGSTTTSTPSTTASRTSRSPVDGRGRRRDVLEELRRLADPGHAERRPVPARDRRRDRAGHARRHDRRRRGDTLSFTAHNGHQRDHPDEHPDRRADQPARVPLAAADQRRAHVRHGARRTSPRRSARRSPTSASLVADYGATTPDLARRRGHLQHARPAPAGATPSNNGSPAAGPGLQRRRHLHGVGAARSTPRATWRSPSRSQNVTQWRVTRGMRDSSNRDSLWYQDATPVTIDQKYHFKFPTMPTEHIFKAGHRIGIIIGGSNTARPSGTGNNNVAVTLDTRTTQDDAADPRRLRRGRRGRRHRRRDGRAGARQHMPADIAVETTDPTGTIGHLHEADRDRQRGSEPGRDLRPGLGLEVPDRHHDRDLHGQGRQRQRVGGEDVQGRRQAPTSRSTRPSAARVPATLSLTLGTPAHVRRVHAGHHADVRGLHHRQRDLDRR